MRPQKITINCPNCGEGIEAWDDAQKDALSAHMLKMCKGLKDKPIRLLPPKELQEAMEKAGAQNFQLWKLNDCKIMVAQEPCRSEERLDWHISISHESRYPTWEEIKVARYSLIPEGVVMAMLLPPKEEFVNLHPNCFHLYQI